MFYLYEISVWVFSLVMAVQGGICTVFLNNALLFLNCKNTFFWLFLPCPFWAYVVLVNGWIRVFGWFLVRMFVGQFFIF